MYILDIISDPNYFILYHNETSVKISKNANTLDQAKDALKQLGVTDLVIKGGADNA
jgi:hypothetical protein